MAVCSYQGVLTLPMGSAPVYSVPFVGNVNIGTFIGALNSIDSWGFNGQSAFGGVDFYINAGWSLQTQLKAHTFPNAGPDLLDFYFYKLTPTALLTWHFQGTVLAAADFYGNPAMSFVGANVIALDINHGSPASMIQGTFPVVTPGNIASPQVTNSLTLTGDTPNSQFSMQGPAINNAGNPCFFYGSQSSLTVDLIDAFWTDWSVNPTAFTTFSNHIFYSTIGTPSVLTNYDPVSKTNYLINIDLSPGAFYVMPYTLSGFTPTFGAQTATTFSGDPATGILNGGGMIARPLNGGWLVQGSVLSDSQWYFADYGFTKYWNLKFGAGPAGNQVNLNIAPVRDAAGNWYNIDIATGNVFTMVSAPVVPYIPSIQQTPSFPLHKCFSPIRPRKVC